MSTEISQQEIDEFIADLAKDHPEYTIDQFKTDFKAAISRDPKFSEVRTFQKSGKTSTLSGLTSKVIEGYMFCEILGKGSFGEVYKCKKDGKDYAVKCIDESKMSAEMEQAFADSISAQLNSKFLIKYFNKFRGPSGELFVVMELCPKGDLRSLIETLRQMDASLNSSRIKKIFVQLLLGLEIMHRLKLIHRDLKPDNVFLDREDNVKIGDFGCTKELGSTSQKANTVIGTPLYESPQVIKGEEYDTSADMWALGVIMYEMCTLKRPFDSTNRYKLQELILAGKYTPMTTAQCPEELASVIRSLLSVDPTKRPSARDLLSSPLTQAYAKEAGLLGYFPSSAIAPHAAAVIITTTAAPSTTTTASNTAIAITPTVAAATTTTSPPANASAPANARAAPVSLPQENTKNVTLQNLPIKFVVDECSRNAFAVTVTGGGRRCEWVRDESDWAILDQEMVAGVYAMEMDFLIPEVKWIEIGLISKAALTADRSHYMFRPRGTCCLAYSKYYHPFVSGKVRIFTGNNDIHFPENLLPSDYNGKVQARLELDLNSNILYFFINGVQTPHKVTNVPSSVYFAVGAISANTRFTVTSFTKTAAPTANPVLESTNSYVWN